MVRLMGRGPRELASTCVIVGTAVSLLGLPGLAHAQSTSGRAASNGPLVVRRDMSSETISLGRARMAKGDCAGALEAFDAALRTGVDVTVHRDRGLCHEQLGHPFPAIDDFRLYLTAVPDAPDSDDIRTRLNQLEVANGLGGTGTGGTSSGPAVGGKLSDHEDPFAVDGSDGKKAATAGTDPQRRGNYDEELAINDQWDQAEASPLRRGTGLTLGAYGRGYGGSQNGLSGYGVGATLRGSLGAVSTIYGEVGYATYSAGSDADTGEREGGVTAGLGYEARIRLDELESNAIILAAVVSYERMTDSNSRGTFNLLDPRAKVGYRHVFGPGFGVEIGAEVAQPLDLASGTAPVTFFGGTLALLVGF